MLVATLFVKYYIQLTNGLVLYFFKLTRPEESYTSLLYRKRGLSMTQMNYFLSANKYITAILTATPISLPVGGRWIVCCCIAAQFHALVIGN